MDAVTLKHDRALDVARGNSRKTKTWKNSPMRWSDMVVRLSNETRTPETMAEYKAMTRARQSEIKDVGGFVGGYCNNGSRSDIRHRSVLCLDADYADEELWADWLLLYDKAAAVYSTHKHTPEKPRLRLVVPLARDVTPDEYQAIGRRVAADLGIDKFELARIGQSTEHNYCGVKCGIMDQFASVFGKAGNLMRLDCRSMEFEYFPFDPEQHGYKLVLLNSCVKHELVGSPYNDRRASCERVAKVLGQEFLRGATMDQLEAIKDQISEEDYLRARYVIGEERRVLDVCDALEKGDYETVGARMYETHWGMSKDYEVSCEELDFLATVAQECGVTGSRIMGGGFGGCTINLVKAELYDAFIEKAKASFAQKYGHEPVVIPVVISDGARKLS